MLLLLLFLPFAAHAESSLPDSAHGSIRELEFLDFKPRKFSLRTSYSYLQLLEHYQYYAETLSQTFPSIAAPCCGLTVLRPFIGSRSFFHFPAAHNPFFLIHAVTFEAGPIEYRRIQLSRDTTHVEGLEIITALHYSLIRQAPNRIYDLLYLSDVNARAFGFSYAQLSLPLSKGVRTATQFEYNGPREWSEHQRYRQDSQVAEPIALTNYGHSSKGSYVISEHPDFAVELEKYDSEEIVLTFLLWQSEPKELPDFVFRIRLRSPTSRNATLSSTQNQ